MRILAGVVVLLSLGCSSVQPVTIARGDICVGCSRVIVDTRLAAQIVDGNGAPQKFRAPACMARYLSEHPQQLRAVFVTDYPSGAFVPATSATFVRVTTDEKTGERDYRAYRSVQAAVQDARKLGTSPIDWIGLSKVIAAERAKT